MFYFYHSLNKIYLLYYFCLVSLKDSETIEEDNYLQFVATPSLISSICNLLNNLIIVGEHEVVRQIYEHSLDKYFLR